MSRQSVYVLIDEERAYQNSMPERPLKDSDTPIASWILYMEHKLNEAKDKVYHLDDQAALERIRQVAALAVACMEYNNTPHRITKPLL